MAQSHPTGGPKPVYLYDHLPGILAGYPAILFLILASIAMPYQMNWNYVPMISEHAIFWMSLAITLVWYIAFRFNLPKSRFWMVFGLLGTFVGIPVVLELTGIIRPFHMLGDMLGSLAPTANASAYLIIGVIFGIIWIGNFIWSRTHLSVKIDTSGLTINRVGGKGERFDLIGLKTEHEPLDYLETFVAGVGSLSLKTRMNKPIFTMKRVMGLYRAPLLPFFPGKLKRIEEILGYQGKVFSVEAQDLAAEADAAADGDSDGGISDDHEVDQQVDGEFSDGGVETADSPDIS